MKQYIKKNKKDFIINVVGNLFNSFLFIYLARLTQSIIDAGISKNIQDLKRYFIYSILFILSITLCKYITRLANARYLAKTMKDVQKDYVKSVLYKDYHILNDENSSKYLSILQNDIASLEMNYFDVFPRLIATSFLVCGALGMMFFYNKVMCLLTVIVYFPLIIMPLKTGQRMASKNLEMAKQKQSLITRFKDVLSGFEVIKSFHSEKSMDQHLNQEISNVQSTFYTLKKMNTHIVTSTNFFAYTAQLVLYLYGGYMIYVGKMSAGALIGCIQLSNQFVSPILSIVDDYTKLKTIQPINQRILENIEFVEKRNESILSSKPFSIELKDVSFSYQTHPVLEKINYTFELGKKYAIVGSSGSGKSTLLKLINGFYQNYSGTIYYDGKDCLSIKDDQYKILNVNQNVFLFEDTIYNNLTLYNEVDQNQFNQILKQTGVDQMLEEMNATLDTQIIENGKNLSGGQKQRLSIARMLIGKAHVLLVDEATSSLDVLSTKQIDELLLSLDQTVINVTHKLDPEILKQYDQILVLNQGHLVEVGDYASLLQQHHYFYNLVNNVS